MLVKSRFQLRGSFISSYLTSLYKRNPYLNASSMGNIRFIFCTWHLFVSLLWQDEKIMCRVLSQYTQIKIQLTKLEKRASFWHLRDSLAITLDICGWDYNHYLVQCTLCLLFHPRPLKCTGQMQSSAVILVPSYFVIVSCFWQSACKLWQFSQALPLLISRIICS